MLRLRGHPWEWVPGGRLVCAGPPGTDPGVLTATWCPQTGGFVTVLVSGLSVFGRIREALGRLLSAPADSVCLQLTVTPAPRVACLGGLCPALTDPPADHFLEWILQSRAPAASCPCAVRMTPRGLAASGRALGLWRPTCSNGCQRVHWFSYSLSVYRAVLMTFPKLE